MTGDWDFYFLRVEDKAASMYVDLGAHGSAPNRNLPFMAYVALYMNSPREDGLSSCEEFDPLIAVEDSLKAHLVNEKTDYVGRCTTNSCRNFFFYVAQPDDWSERVAECMRSFPSYRYEEDTREDASWSTYFSYLYPSDADRQAIENRHVCEALERNGDKLLEAREIDHWAYFSDAASRNAYIAEAAELGFAVRSLSDALDDDPRHSAHLWRVDVPAFEEIDDVALPLFSLARKHGGEYDGWEAIVVISPVVQRDAYGA